MNQIKKYVTVVGAYGHTGKFVVLHLIKRGFTPILSGRNTERLRDMEKKYTGLEVRPISVNNPKSIDDALLGAMAVINCAGPYIDTAVPIVASALRLKIHYLDMSAEQQSVLAIYDKFDKEAFDKNVVVLSAMGFFGGLADLLATTIIDRLANAKTVDIFVALDSWMPTLGTRRTGERNNSEKLIFSNKKLKPFQNKSEHQIWEFEQPFGSLKVQHFPLSEIITLSKHLDVEQINSYINLAPIRDIHDHETPPPTAIDENGRSSQIFLMEVIVDNGKENRRISASGIDIYAITAPIIVEALIRIDEGLIKKSGVVSAGEVFDTNDFLNSLQPDYLRVT